MLQPHNRALVVDALAALDQATQDLEDACNVALSDLPTADEYKLLYDIQGALTVLRAVFHDDRAAAAALWPA